MHNKLPKPVFQVSSFGSDISYSHWVTDFKTGERNFEKVIAEDPTQSHAFAAEQAEARQARATDFSNAIKNATSDKTSDPTTFLKG